MLEELSKKDSYWRKVALNICKDKMLSDDLVNDMYIKLHNCTKEINDFYVVMVIRNSFLTHIKSKKTISIEGFDHIQQTNDFEVDDKQKEILDNLHWQAKGYFEMNTEMSIRKIAKELNTNYVYIHRVMNKARKQIGL